MKNRKRDVDAGQPTSPWSLNRLWNEFSLKSHSGPWKIRLSLTTLAQSGCLLWRAGQGKSSGCLPCLTTTTTKKKTWSGWKSNKMDGKPCALLWLAINSLKSVRQSAGNGVPPGLVGKATLFYVLLTWFDGIHCALSNLADNTKLNNGGRRRRAEQPKTWEESSFSCISTGWSNGVMTENSLS